MVEPTDEDITVPPEEDLLAFSRSGPRQLDDYAAVFQSWKIAGLLSIQNGVDANTQREALRFALGAKWPSQVEHLVQANQIVLSRQGRGDHVTGRWIPGKGTPILIVHPAGSDAALRSASVASTVRSGRPVLILDTFAGSAQRTRKLRSDDYFLSYNRSIYAERVQDILTAAAYLKGEFGGKLQLIGLEDAGVWCVFAAAIAPGSIDVVADLNGFGGSDQDFRNRFFIPGIQRAGGLTTALKLVNRVRAILPASEVPVETAAPVER